jgi:hypothetical protein
MRGMPTTADNHHFPSDSGADTLECAHVSQSDISGHEEIAESDADVCTEPSASKPKDKSGRQSGALRRGTELSRVRGWRTREELIRLRVEEGKSLKECAKLLGRHYNRVRILWREIVEKASGDDGTPSEHRAEVRAFVDLHLRKVARDSLARIAEGAAYGAVVVAALRTLLTLHGVKPEEAVVAGLSLEDVGLEVRAVSPILLAKLEHLEGLGFRVHDQSANDSAYG